MSSAELNNRPYASWRHPLQNAQIRMEVVPLRGLAVRALRFAGKAEPSEVGGLLWGTVVSEAGQKAIIIEQAEFIGADGKFFNTTETTIERLSAALARPRSSLQPLGYFRSAVRGDLFPREQDRIFIESNLSGQDPLVLIIEPLLTGSCTAHFYFVQGGNLQLKESLLRVPLTARSFNERDLTEAGHNPALPMRQHEPVLPADYHFAVHDDNFAAPASSSRGRSLFLAVLLFAMAGVFIYRVMSKNPPSARTDAEAEATNTPIGLQVQRRPDGQLDLNWDRNFVRSANAQGAQLSISDGTYLRTLRLTEDQLLSGKLAYFPRTDDIRFRLEISVGRNRSISESIRVVTPEMYASRFTDPDRRPIRARTEGDGVLDRTRGGMNGPAALNGAAIVKTDTPESYVPASQTPDSAPEIDTTHVTGTKARPRANVIERLLQPAITAVPPPIDAYSAKASSSTNLAAATAAPQNPPMIRPRSPALIPPHATEPDPSAGEPAPPSGKVPVAEPPKPVHQVMPNTKPFGYSLVNNDMTIDIEVHIDESGVVTEARPASRSGRSTMLTAQALIAARKWRFKPAEVNGRKVPSTYIISFKFRRTP
jgi:TonB family protein